MSIAAIRNVRLANRTGLHDIDIACGAISDIRSASAATSRAGPNTLDAAGALALPCLVDPHLHLDLAYSVEIVPRNDSGTLLEAIGLWSEAKKTLTPENVCERALRAIDAEVSHGTGFIRSHVDVGSTAGLRLAEGVLAARETARGRCEIQLVAFPQDGLIRDPGAQDLMQAAIKAGVDLVGGIPHYERTQRDGLMHLEFIFNLAAKCDADIDVHIDETDDDRSVYTEQLAALTIERGWQGRVTASHVCALASYGDVHAARVVDAIAEARINVVTNPGVNLHLQGRFDRYPKRRGLTRVRELLARGVRCGAGQDCIADPFYPLGNGCMLDQAFLLVHADHMSSPALIEQAFAMVCGAAGGIVTGREHALVAGARAHLALFAAASIGELVRLRPRPTAVIHGGAVVA